MLQLLTIVELLSAIITNKCQSNTEIFIAKKYRLLIKMT